MSGKRENGGLEAILDVTHASGAGGALVQGEIPMRDRVHDGGSDVDKYDIDRIAGKFDEMFQASGVSLDTFATRLLDRFGGVHKTPGNGKEGKKEGLSLRFDSVHAFGAGGALAQDEGSSKVPGAPRTAASSGGKSGKIDLSILLDSVHASGAGGALSREAPKRGIGAGRRKTSNGKDQQAGDGEEKGGASHSFDSIHASGAGGALANMTPLHGLVQAGRLGVGDFAYISLLADEIGRTPGSRGAFASMMMKELDDGQDDSKETSGFAALLEATRALGAGGALADPSSRRDLLQGGLSTDGIGREDGKTEKSSGGSRGKKGKARSHDAGQAQASERGSGKGGLSAFYDIRNASGALVQVPPLRGLVHYGGDGAGINDFAYVTLLAGEAWQPTGGSRGVFAKGLMKSLDDESTPLPQYGNAALLLNGGLAALYDMGHAAGGALNQFDDSLRSLVRAGGMGICAEDMARFSRIAAETWLAFSGSRTQFAEALKHRLGDVSGRKFLTTMALLCALQGAAFPWVDVAAAAGFMGPQDGNALRNGLGGGVQYVSVIGSDFFAGAPQLARVTFDGATRIPGGGIQGVQVQADRVTLAGGAILSGDQRMLLDAILAADNAVRRGGALVAPSGTVGSLTGNLTGPNARLVPQVGPDVVPVWDVAHAGVVVIHNVGAITGEGGIVTADARAVAGGDGTGQPAPVADADAPVEITTIAGGGLHADASNDGGNLRIGSITGTGFGQGGPGANAGAANAGGVNADPPAPTATDTILPSDAPQGNVKAGSITGAGFGANRAETKAPAPAAPAASIPMDGPGGSVNAGAITLAGMTPAGPVADITPGLLGAFLDDVHADGVPPSAARVVAEVNADGTILTAKAVGSSPSTRTAVPSTKTVASNDSWAGMMQFFAVNTAGTGNRVVELYDPALAPNDGTVNRSADMSIRTARRGGEDAKAAGHARATGPVGTGSDVAGQSDLAFGGTALAADVGGASMQNGGRSVSVGIGGTLLTMDVDVIRVDNAAANAAREQMHREFAMGGLAGELIAHVMTASGKAEYKIETDIADITPRTEVRYQRLFTQGYGMKGGGAEIVKAETATQTIWTFPTGVTFSKDVSLDDGWYVKPSMGLSVIPSVGNADARSVARFMGIDRKVSADAEAVDAMSYQGILGLELGHENLKVGVNYFLTKSDHTMSHAAQISFTYDF
jgi:hypothetical protein